MQLLVGVVGVYRYNGEEINARLANSEADCLHNAITEKAFGDEEVIRIITTRSKLQILATLNKYKDDHSSSITKVNLQSSYFNLCFWYFIFLVVI